jgi:hypothetical protein
MRLPALVLAAACLVFFFVPIAGIARDAARALGLGS